MTNKLVAYWMSTDIGKLLALIWMLLFGKEQPEVKHPTWPETGVILPFDGWFRLQSDKGNAVLMHLSFQLEGITAEELLGGVYQLASGATGNLSQLMAEMLDDWQDFYPEYLAQGIPQGVEKGAEWALAARIPRFIRARCPELSKQNISTFKVTIAFSHPLPTSRSMSVVEQAEAILAS